MEALVLLIGIAALVLLDLAALRWGKDSRDWNPNHRNQGPIA